MFNPINGNIFYTISKAAFGNVLDDVYEKIEATVTVNHVAVLTFGSFVLWRMVHCIEKHLKRRKYEAIANETTVKLCPVAASISKENELTHKTKEERKQEKEAYLYAFKAQVREEVKSITRIYQSSKTTFEEPLGRFQRACTALISAVPEERSNQTLKHHGQLIMLFEQGKKLQTWLDSKKGINKYIVLRALEAAGVIESRRVAPSTAYPRVIEGGMQMGAFARILRYKKRKFREMQEELGTLVIKREAYLKIKPNTFDDYIRSNLESIKNNLKNFSLPPEMEKNFLMVLDEAEADRKEANEIADELQEGMAQHPFPQLEKIADEGRIISREAKMKVDAVKEALTQVRPGNGASNPILALTSESKS